MKQPPNYHNITNYAAGASILRIDLFKSNQILAATTPRCQLVIILDKSLPLMLLSFFSKWLLKIAMIPSTVFAVVILDSSSPLNVTFLFAKWLEFSFFF